MSGLVDDSLWCGYCGYDLRSAASRICPECGVAFDQGHRTDQLISWERHREFGVVRRYWRTVREICFHPAQSAAKIAWPLDLAAARRFQFLTRILFTLPVLAYIVWQIHFYYDNTRMFRQSAISGFADFIRMLSQSWRSITAVIAGIGVGIFWSVDIPRPFFALRSLSDPRRRRCEGMGYYSAAPLAIMFPLGVAALLGIYWRHSYGIWTFLGERLYTRAVLLFPAVILVWLAITVILLRKTTGASIFRCAAVLALTLIGGIALAAICAVTFFAALNLTTLLSLPPG